MTAFIKRQHWSTISKAFALGVVGMYLCATSAIAAEISVLCSTALSEPMTALVPDFER